MAKNTRNETAVPICQRVADSLGMELVDVEMVKEHTGMFLRVYVDMQGGISLNACEKYHRAVMPLLEHVEYDFLEVSSPGADRPLKKPRDFEKAMGKVVEVRLYQPIDGQKSIEGELLSYSKETISLDTAGGTKEIAIKQAALIRPVITFDEEDLLRVSFDEEEDDMHDEEMIEDDEEEGT